MKFSTRTLQLVISSRGFTLIELLVSLVIIMLVGTLMLTVFFSALRGANKTQTVINLRQSGNFAISQMSKAVRQARSVSCNEHEEYPSLTVTTLENETTVYTCQETNIASTSADMTTWLLDNDATTRISSCSFTCGIQETTNSAYVSLSFSLTGPEDADTSQTVSPLQFTTTIFPRNSEAQ